MTFMLALAIAAAAADFCPWLEPSRYLVYATEDINYARSDFEGPVGAGRSIRLDRFHLGQPRNPGCLALVAGADATLSNGSVYATLEVGGSLTLNNLGVLPGPAFYGHAVNLTNSRARALKTTTGNVAFVQAGGVERFFLEESRRFGARAGQAPEGGPARLRFTARSPRLNTFEVGADTLASATQLEFVGDREATVVVNVRGRAAAIEGKHVELSGGLNAARILFNFPEAETLALGTTGVGDFGLVGLPASVLAPRARTRFENGLMTGQLIVRTLEGSNPGGQVNAGHFDGWGLCGCEP